MLLKAITGPVADSLFHSMDTEMILPLRPSDVKSGGGVYTAKNTGVYMVYCPTILSSDASLRRTGILITLAMDPLLELSQDEQYVSVVSFMFSSVSIVSGSSTGLEVFEKLWSLVEDLNGSVV